MSNFSVILRSLKDKKENTYYVGHTAFPGYIDLDIGATFLVFNSQTDEEELQIALVDPDTTNFSNFQIKTDRITGRLHPAVDRNKSKFYVCKMNIPHKLLDVSNGVDFVIFTSKEGAEEIQIVGPMVDKFNIQRKDGKLTLVKSVPSQTEIVIKKNKRIIINE